MSPGSMTRDCHAGRCPPSGQSIPFWTLRSFGLTGSLPGSLLLQRLKPTSIARDSEPRPAQGPTISGHEALHLNIAPTIRTADLEDRQRKEDP
ncbi:hypothetical protein JMJ77_0011251 [Colletotrichum scovillei]|uniref:Uncharacterized protein n=1 Tax=Colletotrichum scovillei TaxID=1209932 RepID=A0A9P7R1M6_9PEZI|nr:hypothetical protein JMJ77_0011251 [Colletotrichum scovillei]KAG7060229.1 hypothetical protein JMJ78_0015504 [Colletotrichum scovillei]KAG7067680.1 hypothetical protein JMJ76_0009108 [Colletotrichum scovillei]